MKKSEKGHRWLSAGEVLEKVRGKTDERGKGQVAGEEVGLENVENSFKKYDEEEQETGRQKLKEMS